MTNSIELMTERFSRLPSDVQSAVKQFDYDKALQDIHTKYKLHIDQAASLEKALADIIFGDLKSYSLVAYIEKELRLPHERAQEIAFDINASILKPLQQTMKKLQAEDAE